MRPRLDLLPILTLVLGACTASSKDSASTASGSDGGAEGAADGASDGADGATADGGGDGAALVTNGVAPDEPLPAPDFTATNRDGAARDREDLLGQPTAMWFFPAATTAG
jgi:hypothetical protein